MAIEAGDKAPNFDLPTDGDGTFGLKDCKGRKLVLYFYPKDDTPGCTMEAQGFRDRVKDFKRAGAVVVGVSKDSVKRHDSFKAKHGLPFALVSDADGTLCRAYGVWVKKKLYGREYFGIDRATFVIDEKGVVRKTWRKVKLKGHVDDVLDAVKAL